MISTKLAAEIRRLHLVEGWPKNTIARHLGIHHRTVARTLEREALSSPETRRRRSMLDPFVPFVRQTLERFPTLPATRLFEMVRRRGYPGGPDHFRHRLALLGLRPKKPPEAFLELRTLPGEQAQVDWADFGARSVVGGERRLLAFVMVLSYSRHLFVRFFFDARSPSFLAGHVEALTFFQGTCRTLLYDNLKSAVLERHGDAIRYHPKLLELADHYGFSPCPVAPRRGNEKGRVERSIRYLRSSFFPLREKLGLEDLNRAALQWCRARATQRPWPQDRRRTVEQAYREELPRLLPLPAPFPAGEQLTAKVGRSPYVHFDTNRYSVPHDCIQRSLGLVADREQVRIFDGYKLIASHARSWDKQQVIEDPDHLRQLRQAKRHARLHRGQDRLLRTIPLAEKLLVALAQRQRHLATAVDRLLRLLDEYGAEELHVAIEEALAKGSPHPETVRLVLDRRRMERRQKPPIAIQLPDHPKLRDIVVTPHNLADYDDDSEEDPS